MIGRRLLFSAAVCAAAFLLFAGSARADIVGVNVTGTVWRVDGNMGWAPSTAPSGTPELTFTANAVNFFTKDSGTLNDFLNYGGTITSVTGIAGLTDPMSAPRAASPYSTVIEITGTMHFWQGITYTVWHDDGVVVLQGTTDVGLNAASPVPPTASSWYQATDYDGAFTMFYMGTNGNPEELTFSSDVPEPASILFLGTCLVGVAALRRRRLTP